MRTNNFMIYRKSMILFILAGIFVWFEATSWAVPLESLISKKNLPEDWTLAQGPHTYNKKTLFEHINGQAELFLKYGFQKSVFAIYQNKKNREDQIELDIYDMGNVIQAFGIFSRFRNEDRPGEFGLDSFLDDHIAFFYQGKYFTMVYASEPNPDLLIYFSKLVSSKISDSSLPPKEVKYFPKNGLKPGSIQYFSEGLLGHKFLKRGFRGTYIEEAEDKDKGEVKDRGETGGKEFHLFLAIFKDSQEAMNTLKFYKDDLSKKGHVSSETLIQFGTGTLRGEDPYQGKVMVLQKGFYLLGVIGFEKEKNAENRLKEFIEKVK